VTCDKPADSAAEAIRAFLEGRLTLPARKLKENRVRTVWRLEVPGRGALLVKHYRYLRLWDRIRYRFLKDKAEREWSNLRRLREAGIPVPAPVTWGIVKRGEAFFAEEFIEAGAPWPERAGERLVRFLARTVRDLHRVRFLHRDLHVGNVLVAGEKIFLLDFHGGYFLPFLPRFLEVRMLGMLVSSLRVRSREESAAAFLEEYGNGGEEGFDRRVFAYADRHRERHLLSRAKRCVVESTSFTVEKRLGFKLFRRRELDRDTLESILKEPGERIANGPRGEIAFLEAGGKRWSRKTVRYSFLRGYLARFAPGRLYQAWRGGNALLVYGVGVAKPYAYLRRIEWGALREEILVTEELVGFESLTVFLQSLEPSRLSAISKSLAESLADFMTVFHQTRFWQHDLAPKNIMVRSGEDGSWEFRLIDLDRIRRRGLNRRRRFRNLVQLGSVPGVPLRWLDRARFLRRYAAGGYWNRETAKTLTRGILAELEKWIVRESRSDLAAFLGGK